MYRFTYKYVKKYVKKLGYQLIDNTYLNNHTRITLKDNNEYLYYTVLTNLSRSAPRKYDKNNIYSVYNIKLWCKLNDKPFKLLSEEYIDNMQKLKWQCLKEGCGEIFETNWGSISQGQGCGYCAGKQVGLSNCLANKTPELSSQWHSTLNGNLNSYNITVNSHKKVWWICKDGHEWESTIQNRQEGNGCPYCSGFLPSEDNNLLIHNPKLCEEWDYAKNNKSPNEYTKSSMSKVHWKCNVCEHRWIALISNRNKGRGCPQCKESKGEKRISEISLKHGLIYTPQYMIDGCKNRRHLPFDFCFFEDNAKTKIKMIVEYDGILHFEDKFNKPKEFERLQQNDKIKTEYCKQNNIKLIRIPYWDFDNIEQILLKETHLKDVELEQPITTSNNKIPYIIEAPKWEGMPTFTRDHFGKKVQ